MIRTLILYIAFTSLLFSSSAFVLHREPIELAILYTIWFISLCMIISVWFSIRLNIPLNLQVVEQSMLKIKIKINTGFWMQVIEFSVLGMLFTTIAETLNITLWQYLLLILLLFIVYKASLHLPIKRIYRSITLLSMLTIFHFSGYINFNTFNRLNEYFRFIEDILYGIG